MLKVNHLTVRYGHVEAITDISFEVHKGEIVSLLGANGAGKSTSLKCITGLVKPVSGEIIFKGENLVGTRPDKIVRAGLAMSPEGRSIFSELTVLENLEMGAYSRENKAEIAAGIEEVYSLFPVLKQRYKQRGGSLSGGEQQMLAIGRALMAKPELLLLDEPSMGLAPIIVEQITDLMDQLNKKNGLTILLVEQNASMALTISDRAYVMETGTITASGSGEELLNNEDVKRAYLGG